GAHPDDASVVSGRAAAAAPLAGGPLWKDLRLAGSHGRRPYRRGRGEGDPQRSARDPGRLRAAQERRRPPRDPAAEHGRLAAPEPDLVAGRAERPDEPPPGSGPEGSRAMELHLQPGQLVRLDPHADRPAPPDATGIDHGRLGGEARSRKSISASMSAALRLSLG